MESGIWNRVGAAFQAAMDLPAAERRHYLASLSDDIRTEVQDLLEAYEPSAVLEPRLATGPEVGKPFGPYRTVELIGQGGMGAVFRAIRDDGEFSQEVAIKVIGGKTFDPNAEARFLAERQILARLQHPNIVRLLDGGIADGQRYFVMELLRGEKITDYCRSRNLSVEEILRLFLQAGSAIQSAHRSLIIHRDLKPSNIWVTSDGVVKVLDFGIAKIVQPDVDASEPATQARAITLDCASPELVRGESVTTSTDVYSLGLLLYQLLTGVNPQPCNDASLEEALQIICARDPAPPRTLKPDLHRDLEAIVMKAIAKNPAARYSSVEQLNDDVTRYLELRPVSARRITTGYLAARFVSRHRWAVTVAAAIVMLVIAGISAVLWQARKAERERQFAERRFDHSRRLIRSLVVDLQEKLRAIPATLAVRKTLVEDSIKYLEELSADAADRPDLILEIAATYEKLGALQGSLGDSSLGDFDGADRTFRKGLALAEKLVAANPEHAKAVIQAAKLHTSLGFSRSKAMTKEERHQHQVKAAELARKAQVLNPSDRASREFLATSYFYTATARLGKPDELELWNKALQLSTSLEKERPGHPNLLRNVALVHKNLSGFYQRQANMPLTLEHARKALEIDEQLLARQPGDPRTALDVAIDLNAVANGLHLLGKVAEAIPYYRKSIEIRGSLAARNPQDARYQDRYAWSMFNLSEVLVRSNPKESLALATHAVSIWRKLLAPGPSVDHERFLGQALVYVGLGQQATGRNGCPYLRESERLLQSSAEELRKTEDFQRIVNDLQSGLKACK